MDNDRKVIAPVRAGTSYPELLERINSHFLTIKQVRTEDQRVEYNLETEFTKAKYNRSWVVVFGVTALTIIFVVLGVVVNRAIEQASATVVIDSAAFKDTEIRETLAAARRNTSDLYRAQFDVAQLQFDRDTELQAARTKGDQDLAMFRAKGASADQIEAFNKSNEAAVLAAQRGIQGRYGASMKQKQVEIDAIKQRIETLENSVKADAEKIKIIDAQARAFQLEQDQVREQYEARIKSLGGSTNFRLAAMRQFQAELDKTLRETAERERLRLINLYNPNYTDANSSRLINAARDEARSQGDVASLQPGLTQTGLVDQGFVDGFRANLRDIRDLIALLKRVPYQNSVPGILEQLDARILASGDNSANLSARLLDSLQTQTKKANDQQSQLAQLEGDSKALVSGMATLANRKGDDGYVLQVLDNKIRLVISDKRPIKVGDKIQIMRGAFEVVAEGQCSQAGNPAVIDITKRVDNKTAQPMDTVRFQ